MFKTFKRILVGEPLLTSKAHEQRLSKRVALAIFSSDALSSVAYATEEILLVLVVAGVAAVQLSLPVALAIGGLLLILISSYSQTIHAYPSGGGAYIVAKENLGKYPGLVAASSLLTDYILTAAVSIASGVAAITSAFPALFPYKVHFCLFFIFLITIANLRGVKESGVFFSIPTYMYIGAFLTMIGFGLYEYFSGHVLPVAQETSHYPASTQALTLFLVLRAFSSGCAALTGVEAISNGVPAFEKPESRNATVTLIWMGIILFALFIGITELSRFFHVLPKHDETVVSQLARQIFKGGYFYYVVQVATTLILILAANTAFAGFPRLASLLAQDNYMPRQLNSLGDRLAFSNGIMLLGLASGLLVVLFNANTHRLIPLYAVGVFTSFTLSQSGMVLHWVREKGRHWVPKVFINSSGSIATLVALVVIGVTKFTHGAWMVFIFIPLVILWFLAVHKHYASLPQQLHPDFVDLLPAKLHRVLIPISTFHKGTVKTLSYALSLSNDVRAVYVGLDPERTRTMQDIWKGWCIDIPLVILESPYRSIIQPLTQYIDQLQAEEPDQVITVVIPEFVPAKWWQAILHNQTAWMIRGALLFKKGVVVTTSRHFLER